MSAASTNSSTCPDASRHTGVRVFHLAAFAVMAALAVFLSEAEVAEDFDGIIVGGRRMPSSCVVRRMTGKPCPGCGTTRAMVLLFDGQVRAAAAVHPSAPWLGLWLVVQLAVRLTAAVAPAPFRRRWPLDLALSLATLGAASFVPIILRMLAG